MAEVKTQGAVEAMEVAEASRQTEWEKPRYIIRTLQVRYRTRSPGRIHGDRRVQRAGTASDGLCVCGSRAPGVDVSPGRQQPLCRGSSRGTPRGEPCGAHRHPGRWGGNVCRARHGTSDIP